jgi:hypothetical protein
VNITGDKVFAFLEFPIINVLIESKYVESLENISAFADYIPVTNTGQTRYKNLDFGSVI